MKGLLVLLVFSAVGLAGVLYWRQSLKTPSAPVIAATGGPAKEGKERHRRRRRGARRLARNEVLVASAPPGEAPSGEAPSGETPTGEAPSPAFAPPPEERAPVAPGGASTTEVPGADVFGAFSPAPKPAPSGG